MIISKEQATKLGKYFINADPFLWGVLQAKNKKGRLKELKQMGFLSIYTEGSNPIYSKINRDLLVFKENGTILGKRLMDTLRLAPTLVKQ